MDHETVSNECQGDYHDWCVGVVDHLVSERKRVACRCEHPNCHTQIPF